MLCQLVILYELRVHLLFPSSHMYHPLASTKRGLAQDTKINHRTLIQIETKLQCLAREVRVLIAEAKENVFCVALRGRRLKRK